LSPSPQKYGFGIRDPGSGKNLFLIPDPGVKKAPDPGSRIRIRNTAVQYTDASIPDWHLPQLIATEMRVGIICWQYFPFSNIIRTLGIFLLTSYVFFAHGLGMVPAND
jgi:hypothetical protein